MVNYTIRLRDIIDLSFFKELDRGKAGLPIVEDVITMSQNQPEC